MHAMRLQNTTKKEKIKMGKNKFTNVIKDGEKKLMTIGWIKSIDLTAKTFTIEPVSAYRFQIDEKDDNSWKIIFKDESKENAVDSLTLCDKEQSFKMHGSDDLISALVILKQNKTKIKIKVESIAKDVSCEIMIP